MEKVQKGVGMNENFRDEIFIATLERTIRRLWILCILLILLLVGTNVAWLYYESQFEDVVTTTETIDALQDGEGPNIVGGGDVNYGTTSENKKDNN